jgi:hypothetical protein
VYRGEAARSFIATSTPLLLQKSPVMKTPQIAAARGRGIDVMSLSRCSGEEARDRRIDHADRVFRTITIWST